MKVMMIVKANKDSEAGVMPTGQELAIMGAFNEELVKAGVLRDASGLKPSSKGARVSYRGGRAQVTDGPFAETKELIAGFWVIEVQSMDEAIAWAKRAPFPQMRNGDETVVEIRPFFELEDFPEVPDNVAKLEREMKK
jgi:hypothetical protein